MHSLGYEQVLQHLRGDISLAQAIVAARQGHRNYAKRQMTWFRREPDVTWLEGFGDDASVVEQAAAIISSQSPAPSAL